MICALTIWLSASRDGMLTSNAISPPSSRLSLAPSMLSTPASRLMSATKLPSGSSLLATPPMSTWPTRLGFLIGPVTRPSNRNAPLSAMPDLRIASATSGFAADARSRSRLPSAASAVTVTSDRRSQPTVPVAVTRVSPLVNSAVSIRKRPG